MKPFAFIIILLSLLACQEQQKPVAESQKTSNEKKINVGVFSGNGAGAVSVIETVEALKIDPKINAFPLSPADIMTGKLNQTDVVIFPGGSGSKQLNSLGRIGKEKITDYVKKGHGLIGICAGAYMLCKTDGYPSLKLGDVKHLDRPHYARGRGLIEFKLNEEGLKIFPEFKGKPQFIQYYDGPILQALQQDKTFKPVATYVTDIHPNAGDPVGLTPGKLFMYHQQVGKGRVFAIGGHAESTPGIRFMIPRMARWVSNQPLVSYNKKWIVPEKNDHAILFDTDLKKKEKRLFWQLFDSVPKTRIAAMDSLYDLRSRPAVRWNQGMLRDNNPEVRTRAAYLLTQAEYTDAFKDLKAGFQNENNPDTKKAFKKAIDFLKY